jgi:hypothetical protein
VQQDSLSCPEKSTQQLPMSYPEYEDDVLRTLSLQFNIGNEEAGPYPTPGRIAETLKRAIKIGDEVDVLKRAVFYGSNFVDSSNEAVPPMEMSVGDDESDDYPTADMIHSAMGIFTEAAEFLSAVYSSCFEDQSFDTTNAIEELGDLEWYMAVMRKRLGVMQEQVQRINIAKLKARYPDKFATREALNRDLEHERSILESSGE